MRVFLVWLAYCVWAVLKVPLFVVFYVPTLIVALISVRDDTNPADINDFADVYKVWPWLFRRSWKRAQGVVQGWDKTKAEDKDSLLRGSKE